MIHERLALHDKAMKEGTKSPYFDAWVAESVDASALKAAGYYNRASSSLASGTCKYY